MKKLYSVLILIFLAQMCFSQTVKKSENIMVKPGNENFFENFLHLVKDKKVGLVTNPSGVNSTLQYTTDLLYQHPEVNLTALFGPEHGVRGDIYAGDKVSDEIDEKTGIPVFSLYGEKRKPTREMLQNVDILIIDIQDIGLRAYTYIYTMAHVMEAAQEHNKKVLVFDRPNPIGGVQVEGNLVEEEYFSFVGLYPIPYRPGMTIGELARLFNSEYDIGCDLTVIPMQNWTREMMWDDTGLPWVTTSPHVPHWETILQMIATGTIGELHAVSVGVGYTSPFEIIGAPWINAEEFASALNDLELEGIIFRPLYFKPFYSIFEGENCRGVQLHITDQHSFEPYITGIHIMTVLMDLYPDHDLFDNKHRIGSFNRVMGNDRIKKQLEDNVPVSEIKASWQDELNEFKEIRKKYLLY